MTCAACGSGYNVLIGERTALCTACRTRPCWGCGKTYAEHDDSLPASGIRPRMPCVGIKSGFFPRIDPPPQPSAAAPACPNCSSYRTALRAIVTGASNGVPLGALGDLAQVALLAPEVEAERRSRT